MHHTLRATAAKSLRRGAVTAIAAGALLGASVVSPAAAEGSGATVLAASVSSVITLPETDGFNDSVVLDVNSDAAITVQPQVLNAAAAPVGPALSTIALTDPEADGTFSGSLSLSGLGLGAGTYSVAVTEVGQTLAASAPLVIGSGTAVTVSLAVPSRVYPYKDGYADAVTATVGAFDETGTAVPFTGAVQVKSGVTKKVIVLTSSSGAPASVTVPVTGFPLGTGSSYAKAQGPAGAHAYSATKTIAFSSTLLTSAKLTVKPSTVYPVVDGYGDSGKFTFSAVSSTGKTTPVTGTVKVYYGSKLVKSWNLTSSATKSLTWNGLNGGRLVPGKYTVKVSVKGPQGSTKTATSYVNVSKKRLVSKTYSRVLDAGYVADEYEWYGATEGECLTAATGTLRCLGYDSDGDGISLTALGSAPIPSAVRSAHSATVRVTANVDRLSGAAAWGYSNDGLDGPAGELKVGNSVLGWMPLKKGVTDLILDVWLGEYTDIVVDQYLVEYRYKLLL